MDRNVLIAFIALGGVSAFLLAGLASLVVRFNRLQRRLVLLQGDGRDSDFVAVVSAHIEAVRQLDVHTAMLDDRVAQLRDALAGAVQRVGVVRYDAFADMGGHLSFSAAFLDEHGNGIVLTCINSRTDARMYAKGVLGGEGGDGLLSDEELAAIRLAMNPEHAYQPAG